MKKVEKRGELTVAGDFDAEDEAVADAHRLHVALGARIDDADARRWCGRRRRDAGYKKKTIINTRIQTTFRLLPWCIIRTGLISLELIQILKFTCVLFFKIGFNCT